MTNLITVPPLHFDGQFVDVSFDHHESAVKWFEQYFAWKVVRQENWKVDPRCLDGKMTQLNYGTWVVSYLADSRLPHHYAERGMAEPHIRLCFRVKDLMQHRQTFLESGLQVSPLYEGPKTTYLDVWATTEGIRFTLQEDKTVSPSEVLPSWIRVGVSYLDESVAWYERHIGMEFVERDKNGKYVMMRLKLNHSEEHSLWIIEQIPENTAIGKVDGQAQPYCWIKDREAFFGYHQYLINNGIETSEIGGFLTKGMVSFHFYDPDGNRFNVSSM